MWQQVRELANKTGLDFTEQIAELEERYDQVGDTDCLEAMIF